MKWYIACAGDRALTGGSTPNASQVRKITSVGWPAMHGIRALRMKSIGIGAARVLRDAGVGEVDGVVLVEHDVLQHGAEAQGLEDVRLRSPATG